MADVEITERNRLSPVARGAQMGISGEIDGSVHGRLSLTVSRTEAGRAMFYPITSLAVRQCKGELDAFGRIDAGPRPRTNRCISPRDKRIAGE
jgi:hypothetical protein